MSHKIKLATIVMVVGIGLLSGCSITQDISLLEDDNKKLTYSEDYIVVINPDDIISVAVEEHYGEGHSDARRVEYFVKDGIYYESFFDYGKFIGYTNISTKEDFDSVVDASLCVNTVKKYNHLSSPVWFYAAVRTKNGTIYYLNNQDEVSLLSDYL